LPDDVEHDVQPLLESAARERDAAQERVVEALRSTRYLDLVDRLVQGAIAPRMRPEASTATTRDLTRLARKPWKKLKRDHAALGADPADATLHALRIRAKRVRYAAEAVAGAVGGDAPQRFADAVAGVQEVLGDHQDAVVAQAWLRDHVDIAAPCDGATTYAAGMLAGMLRADALAATAALPAAWKRAKRRKLRAWL
jgi:CHAD domain-containing protein